MPSRIVKLRRSVSTIDKELMVDLTRCDSNEKLNRDQDEQGNVEEPQEQNATKSEEIGATNQQEQKAPEPKGTEEQMKPEFPIPKVDTKIGIIHHKSEPVKGGDAKQNGNSAKRSITKCKSEEPSSKKPRTSSFNSDDATDRVLPCVEMLRTNDAMDSIENPSDNESTAWNDFEYEELLHHMETSAKRFPELFKAKVELERQLKMVTEENQTKNAKIKLLENEKAALLKDKERLLILCKEAIEKRDEMVSKAVNDAKDICNADYTKCIAEVKLKKFCFECGVPKPQDQFFICSDECRRLFKWVFILYL